MPSRAEKLKRNFKGAEGRAVHSSAKKAFDPSAY